MSAPKVIGVYVGGTKILAGVIDEDGNVLERVQIASPAASTEALLAGLDQIVTELLSPEIAAIGFGIPSSIDQRSGMVLGTVNLPLQGLYFRQRMSERFELPVGIDNDANVAAIAEWKAGAGLPLGDSGDVGVVVDADRKLEALAHPLAEVEALEGQVDGAEHHSRALVDARGNSESDRGYLRAEQL